MNINIAQERFGNPIDYYKPGFKDFFNKLLLDDLYQGDNSLEGCLFKIGERLHLKEMPWLKNNQEKSAYLQNMELRYLHARFNEFKSVGMDSAIGYICQKTNWN